MSAKGRVRISGKGLRTVTETLAAGTHQIRVKLTAAGRSLRSRHEKTTVQAKLTVGKQAGASTAHVKL